MDSHLVKMFLALFCFVFASYVVQGTGKQCVRTNSDPSRHCTDECMLQLGCRNRRKKCLCDGDCGYSCIYPRMRCSRPRKTRNGRIIFTTNRFNATQTTECRPGFKLSGSAVRTCRGNGYWDGRQARCRRPQKNCNDPGKKGLLLRVNDDKKSFKPGTKLEYYCPFRFILRGSKYLVCRNDGTWSASLPQCIVPKCSPAVLPAHAKVLHPTNWRNRRDYGTRFTLSCNYGYTYTERGTLVCDAPRWRLEPSSFKCFPKSCPNPGTLRNGNIKGLFRFGEKVYYTCDKCFTLRGPAYRQCQADQRWSDSQPTCEPVSCSLLQSPANGYLTHNSQQCDSIVQYYCDYGYQLKGPNRRRCHTDGTWTGSEPTCEVKTCPDPGAPKYGHRFGTFQVGKTIRYSCQDCYRLEGVPSRTCQSDLTWTGSQPRCLLKRCRPLSAPRNGRKTRDSTNCGRYVEFSCNRGYQLEGSNRRYCQSNGQWSGAGPVCYSSAIITPRPTLKTLVTSRPSTTQLLATTTALNSLCGHPKFLSSAKILLHRGNQLILTCKKSHSTISLGRMLCNQRTKKWQTVKASKCLAKGCANPGVPKNGFKHGLSYFINDVVGFSCLPCYQLVGNSQRTCLKNKTWSSTQPKCVLKTCPPLNDTAEATVSYISQDCKAVATYTCRSRRLIMVGSGVRTCNESKMWEGVEPKCIELNVNIALKKPAFMSSHWAKYGGPASAAVDGNRKGKLVHTHREWGPWWKVDLQREETVSTVILVNRHDCCIKRMYDFKVSVGNNPKEGALNTLCAVRRKAVYREMKVHCTTPLQGRYVFVYFPKGVYTSLEVYEIEVYRKKLN